KTVIAISGEIDIICDGSRTCILRGGCATMARITGSGCMLTALMGAFCGSWDDSFAAACAATAAMGVSGETAERKRLQNGTGNATFRSDLIDAVFNLTGEQLTQGANYEIHER
ncbi:MAG: hydroxyethylthiazole kinase, partial [Firmicutes bacterium]|nr:hydroxyethylthiazole kinase [Bacillota bacterium]